MYLVTAAFFCTKDRSASTRIWKCRRDCCWRIVNGSLCGSTFFKIKHLLEFILLLSVTLSLSLNQKSFWMEISWSSRVSMSFSPGTLVCLPIDVAMWWNTGQGLPYRYPTTRGIGCGPWLSSKIWKKTKTQNCKKIWHWKGSGGRGESWSLNRNIISMRKGWLIDPLVVINVTASEKTRNKKKSLYQTYFPVGLFLNATKSKYYSKGAGTSQPPHMWLKTFF